MVSPDTARNVVGILGNILSLILFLSPVPTFVGIWKKRSVQQYSATPYLATVVNCMVWTLYGLPIVHPHNPLVLTINGTGTAIELFYVVLFIVFTDKKTRPKVVLALGLGLVFMALVSLLVLSLAHTTKKRTLIVGFIGSFFNIIMYTAPLSVMKMVIRTQSVEYMPFFLSFASFANGAAWTAYALILFDPFIAVPNGLGSLLAMSQLILYAMFYKSTKRQIEARNAKGGEMDLSQVVVNGNANCNKSTNINGDPLNMP